MAIWIYHGPAQYFKTQGGDHSTIYLRDGEYFSTTYENLGQNYTLMRGHVYENTGQWSYIEFNWAKSTSPSSLSIPMGGGGYLRRMERANSIKWGSHNYHAASGGNYYTVRKTTYLYHKSNLSNRVSTLYAGDKIIVGMNAAYFQSRAVRIWGFKRQGQAVVETFGLVAGENPFVRYPSSYHVNTI